MTLTYRQKRHLYPTVICYHGCVSHRAAVLTFREHVADIQSHVRSLQAAGYLFLLPSQYKAWQQGLATYDRPVTCLHFDDCLGSINLVIPWLIEQGIPCGIAVITRRIGKMDPERDFSSWGQLREWTSTGLVELMSHTHNMHHLTLIESGGAVDVAPVLEAPCWIDDGDVLYSLPGDARWYWDFSFIDTIASGLPVWGTDPYDGVTPIQTRMRITPKVSGNVSVLRMWMALSRPDGSGYPAEVEISVRNAPVLVPVPPASFLPGLEYWFENLGYGAKRVVLIGDSTTEIAPALYAALESAATSGLLPEVEFINRGNDGKTAADWLAGAVPNPPAVCYADAADLYVVSFGLNDVRGGGVSAGTLASRLTAIVNALRLNVPAASILLRMPNSMLSADPTGSGWVVPLSSAQAYTDIIRAAYLSLVGAWPGSVSAPGVAVWDVMTEIFGTTCVPSSPLMRDILHPNDTGYTAIGEGMADLLQLERMDTVGGSAETQVWAGVISPKQYETRAQWVEREFYSIELDAPFSVTAGTAIEMSFRTLNVGRGAATMYCLMTSQDSAFSAVTNCRGLYPEGSQGAPNKFWQYIDCPAGDRWPVIPCVIMGFGSGRPATVEEYQDYIGADCDAAQQAIDGYLNAEWSETIVWRAPTLWWYWETQRFFTAEQSPNPAWPTFGDYYPFGWNYPNRVLAIVPLRSVAAMTVEWLRLDITGPERFIGGDADPFGPLALDGNPTGRAIIAEAESRGYSAAFELAISTSSGGPWTRVGDVSIWRIIQNRVADVEPFELPAGATRYLRILPINGGPTVGTERRTRWGLRTVTAGAREAVPYELPVDQIVYPFGSYFAGDGIVQNRPGFKDVASSLQDVFSARGITHGYTIQAFRNVVTGEAREPDLRQTEYALGRWMVYGDQAPAVSLNNLQAYSGYLFQDVKHRGVKWQASLEPDPLGNATVRAKVGILDYVAFDAWFFDGAGGIARGTLNDGLTYIDVSDVAGTFAPGDVVTEAESGATATVVWYSPVEVMSVTAVSPGWLGGYRAVVGPAGTATGSLNGPQTYADDKGWLQTRGVRCLLIINNNLGTGEPDADIGSHVVNNPATYVPLIVAAAVDNGWDGITCNIEAVPAADRAAATTFYRQLARAMHAAGKLLHATVPAATGTDYDAEFWTGWCDHGEIVKVCDAIKVMSYTETGPGTAPGPAAPTAFWNAVYARMRAVIPEPYWPRVLCGCRSFGHRWDVAAGTADFITYHQGIAGALTYGKRVDVRDTEAGWGTDNIKVWFGTPATVDRAQREAAESFGGIGLWKLDDGDVQEFFPDRRQIGIAEDDDFMEVRLPTKISMGAIGGPGFRTAAERVQSGHEARAARWTMPLHEYDVSFAVQDRELFEEVRNLFMVARGRWKGFRFKDFADYEVKGHSIGVADGVVTNFQLRKDYQSGPELLTRIITKPVQGSLRLYRNGIEVPPGQWVANYRTGLVSFITAPAPGVISADFEFDVPVRFDIDALPTELLARAGAEFLFSQGTITLRELRTKLSA